MIVNEAGYNNIPCKKSILFLRKNKISVTVKGIDSLIDL